MTRFVFDFSVFFLKNRAPLTCVWTETGDPRQPLACHWVAQPHQSANRAAATDRRRRIGAQPATACHPGRSRAGRDESKDLRLLPAELS